MLNKFKVLIFLVVFMFIFWPTSVLAKNQVDMYFFYGEGCPHCAAEEKILPELEAKYSNLVIHRYEVWYNTKNANLMQKVGKLLNVDVRGVPFNVIGKQAISGFSEGTTEAQIKALIEHYSYNDYDDPVAAFSKEITLPIIGKIDPSSFSLPIITVIMGLLDGFNPCAMWVLLFLISMLLGMKDHKKRWILGVTFIATSAVIYLLFMAAWLNVAIFAGSLLFIRILIAIAAIGGGSFSLYSALKTKDDGCEIVKENKRTKIFDKIKKFTKEKSLLLAMLGIMTLAISVNIIELLCSAGLPVIYTQILSMNSLSPIQYAFYLMLYIFFFIIDDLIVFFIAMKTLQLKGISTKYGKASHLIGGIIMIIIGLLLVFQPGWLMFG